MVKTMKKDNDFGYIFLKFILSPIFKLYYNPKIIGQENIPKTGPIIIAGNHKHLYDQCHVMISTKRVVHYLAKKEYFDSKMAWFFKLGKAIPVDRNNKDENAKNAALDILNNNGAIGIYPEGTRNKTNELLLPFKYGAVSLAKKSNAAIVPVAVIGDHKFRSKNLITKIGKPFQVNDMTIEEANIYLKKEIENLLKEKNNICK